MKIFIFGGSGFIGQHLCQYWTKSGHDVYTVSRHQTTKDPHTLTWEQLEQHKQVDLIVNLCGSSLQQRWTKKAKEKIIASRLKSVEAIGDWVHQLDKKPKKIIQSSGISIYPPSLEKHYDENSSLEIVDFLSEVATKWEEAAKIFEDIPIVFLRTAIVLGKDGGAFPLMRLPSLLKFGGRLGTGKQWFPWIHIQDMIRLIDFCASHSQVQGPINACAPEHLTQAGFSKALAHAMHSPYWFHVPSWMLKIALGEMSNLLLQGQRVTPKRILEHGFSFTYSKIESALKELCSNKEAK